MKQRMKKNEDKPLSERPDWFDTYLHLKYKLTKKIPPRFASLGLMSMEDIGEHMAKSMWELKRVKAAVIVLVKEGLLDLVYKTEDGKLWTENFSLPEHERTLDRIINGDLFDKTTGKRYDVSKIERFYAIPRQILEQIPESAFPESRPTILGRIRRWLSNG